MISQGFRSVVFALFQAKELNLRHAFPSHVNTLTTCSSEQRTPPSSQRSENLHRSGSPSSGTPGKAERSSCTHTLQRSCHPQLERRLTENDITTFLLRWFFMVKYSLHLVYISFSLSAFKQLKRTDIPYLHATANRAKRMNPFMIFCSYLST